MVICSKCKKVSLFNTKFCSACGTVLGKENETIEVAQREEFIGKVYKCPNCGTEIPSMTGFCPGCGMELKSTKTSEGAKDFIKKISEYDVKIANDAQKPYRGWTSWGILKKCAWVYLNLITVGIPFVIYYSKTKPSKSGYDKLTSPEREKTNFINGYIFPNDREAIIEALMFINNQVSILASSETDVNSLYWMMIWKNKSEQLSQKIVLLFKEDSVSKAIVENIGNIYENAKREYNNRRKNRLIIFFIVFLLILLLCCLAR